MLISKYIKLIDTGKGVISDNDKKILSLTLKSQTNIDKKSAEYQGEI